MIKSMTGFGRSDQSSEERKLLVEIKSVNHRYCDINIRLPKKLLFLESKIRNLIKNYVDRGKIDVFITYEEYINSNIGIKYNEKLAHDYMEVFKRMEDGFNLENDIRVSTLARFPEVIILEEQTTNEDDLWPDLEKAIEAATIELVEARKIEGQNLLNDLISKLDLMDEYVSIIEEKAPEIVEEHYRNLKAKVEELLGDTKVEESILATEVATFADKVSVDEEIVRLKSHISNMRETLESEEGIGRKLDFIAQEMNREANTILSKVNDLEVTNVAIDLKTEVEKVREQIQNIE
ncbi:MAG: YicC family protein [Clostridiales bacterium]|nr:YicC family protein [Clostridiales bacterium]